MMKAKYLLQGGQQPYLRHYRLSPALCTSMTLNPLVPMLRLLTLASPAILNSMLIVLKLEGCLADDLSCE